MYIETKHFRQWTGTIQRMHADGATEYAFVITFHKDEGSFSVLDDVSGIIRGDFSGYSPTDMLALRALIQTEVDSWSMQQTALNFINECVGSLQLV